jgi:flagellar hook-associated protein 1 FlgK
MGDFSSLEIGKRALLAQRLGLNLTSNNISNVNTPGYSRRDAILQETNPLYKSGTFLGTGVIVNRLKTYREEFFDKEIRTNIARNSTYKSDEKIITRLETIFAEPSDNGLNELTSGFFNSFEELSLQPENLSYRESVLNKASALVDRLHSLDRDLNGLRDEVLNELNLNVSDANQIIEKIAKLNKSLANSRTLSGEESQTYADQRALLLEELSGSFNVTSTVSEDGVNNVFINGINVVTGGVANRLKVFVDVNGVSGEKTARIVKVDKQDNIISSVNPQNGEAASLLKAYNVMLDDRDSSGGISVNRRLNDFASALVQKVNSITITGYGLNDTGPVPPGRTFFEPSVGNVTAGNISISSDILNSPANIPIADAPGEPGNNSLALLLSGLADDSSFLTGTTPTGYLTSLLGSIGNLGNEALNGRNTTDLVAEQLISQRESIIGVNLDEEAINLIKYQKAFEAASRIVNVTNELLGTIINLGR